MGRWEPDARERLVRAALDLFEEQGYDDTTIVQIASRAGLTKSTFFRHFPDKREVLFGGQDSMSGLLADGITAAPESATALEAVAAGLQAVAAAFTDERSRIQPQRLNVVAANSELREREALKLIRLSAAMTEALKKRGVPDSAAGVAAELGLLAFREAYQRWATSAGEREFGELARLTWQELLATTSSLL
ncbi:helix-turn-helix domain-containing protein [Lentzea sp. NPDC005914]|uniref:TetR/AcrR family transcriptional regulator n=1 Tax=Lentzea sp. NPDC005914 TaxID=3154572 RepID=UPI0033ED6B33